MSVPSPLDGPLESFRTLTAGKTTQTELKVPAETAEVPEMPNGCRPWLPESDR